MLHRSLCVASAVTVCACTNVDEPSASEDSTTAADGTGTSGGVEGSSTGVVSGSSGADDGGTSTIDGDTGATTGPTVDRGPTELELDGDANGLWWDADAAVLYIADDNGNRILQWSDTDGFGLVADLPVAPVDGAGLGQLVRLADGTFVVTRFGFGSAGDVIVVPPSGDAFAVPGLDPERRRIGLTVADDGTLYDAWFVKVGDARVGAVGRLDLAGGETVVIDGLVKPVAVLADGESLLVADQDLGQILRAPIAAPMDYQVLVTNIEGPDLMGLGPDGSYFTGGADGSVRRVLADGSFDVFAGGFDQIRGVAYDAANTRLFVADHDADESDGIDHAIQILPVDL